MIPPNPDPDAAARVRTSFGRQHVMTLLGAQQAVALMQATMMVVRDRPSVLD